VNTIIRQTTGEQKFKMKKKQQLRTEWNGDA